MRLRYRSDGCQHGSERLVAGSSFTIAANLFRGENLDWARERLRLSNDPPTGAMFWMHPMALLMHAGREELNEDDWAFIRELWRTYFPYRGDTENHWVMYYVSLYLVAEMFPDAGPEAWYNGKSSKEIMADAKGSFSIGCESRPLTVKESMILPTTLKSTHDRWHCWWVGLAILSCSKWAR